MVRSITEKNLVPGKKGQTEPWKYTRFTSIEGITKDFDELRLGLRTELMKVLP